MDPNKPSGMRLDLVDECVIVYAVNSDGGIPVKAFSLASKMVSKGAVMDMNLARIYGAHVVAGKVADLDILRSHSKDVAEAFVEKSLRYADILASDAMRHWIGYGDVGISSAFLIGHLLRARGLVDFAMGSKAFQTDYVPQPHDDHDRARCVAGLLAQPELVDRLDAFVGRFPVWADDIQKIRTSFQEKLDAEHKGPVSTVPARGLSPE